uniref:EGF-like domain-containing protein n=1 Tax=Anguilla anguilla TaxID=7936 RepID=A0A0E9SEM4_ANGAN
MRECVHVLFSVCACLFFCTRAHPCVFLRTYVLHCVCMRAFVRVCVCTCGSVGTFCE